MVLNQITTVYKNEAHPSSSPLWTLGFISFIKFVLIGIFIHYGIIGLGPDEAQYWTWSQQLDIGYYSKPPGIAWQIALGTALFGNTEFGVRFGSLVIGFLLPFAVYSLARECRLKPWTCFWAAIIMAFSPLGMLSSVLAITDGGMVLFWALAMALICHDLTQNITLSYYRIGLLIACGALFKWPIYLLWITLLPLIIWQKKLFSPRFFGGILISLLGIIPSLLWNLKHDFPTFKHVISTINTKHTVDLGTSSLMKGNFLEFLGAQSLLISPILFICMLAACFVLVKRWRSQNLALQYCGAVTLLDLFCLFAAISFFKKMQGNWCDFLYPSACVMIAWYGCEVVEKAKNWIKAGIALSLAMVIALLAFPQAFKHNLGWHRLAKVISENGYNPNTDFLFSDKYQMTSLLSFYGPEQKRAYFLNLLGIRKNQFSYWPGMEAGEVGHRGFFVIVEKGSALEMEKNKIEKQYEESLAPYFDQVKFVGAYPLVFWKEEPYKMAYIFVGEGYNGKTPPETGLY